MPTQRMRASDRRPRCPRGSASAEEGRTAWRRETQRRPRGDHALRHRQRGDRGHVRRGYDDAERGEGRAGGEVEAERAVGRGWRAGRVVGSAGVDLHTVSGAGVDLHTVSGAGGPRVRGAVLEVRRRRGDIVPGLLVHRMVHDQRIGAAGRGNVERTARPPAGQLVQRLPDGIRQHRRQGIEQRGKARERPGAAWP